MPSHSRKLILASGSPRRKMLLRQAGYEFAVVVPSDAAECGMCSNETPPELVARLAYQKAQDVAQRFDQGLVLACDTVVECLGQTLGKPANPEHARQMLTLLRGRTHHVYSGVCLWRRPDDQTLVEVAVTRLRMDDVSDAALEEYLESGLWEGKAGAFGYQDRLGWLHLEEGGESNVVGLPLELVQEMIAAFEAMPGGKNRIEQGPETRIEQEASERRE
jgi:septum formation protein